MFGHSPYGHLEGSRKGKQQSWQTGRQNRERYPGADFICIIGARDQAVIYIRSVMRIQIAANVIGLMLMILTGINWSMGFHQELGFCGL